jgi:hypothetical protein
LRIPHQATIVVFMHKTRFEIRSGISRSLLAALLLTVAALVAASPFFKTSSLRLSSIEAGEAVLSRHGIGLRE